MKEKDTYNAPSLRHWVESRGRRYFAMETSTSSVFWGAITDSYYGYRSAALSRQNEERNVQIVAPPLPVDLE